MPVTTDQYAAKAKRVQEREKRITLAGQDIGSIPPVKDHARRAAADADYVYFCDTYLKDVFYLPSSEDQLRVCGKIQTAVTAGGMFAVAMPRGDGKTMRCDAAVLWAMLTGRHAFTMLVGATDEHAGNALDRIKTHLRFNPLLYEDYPEAIHPIRQLDGESRRCVGQRYYGMKTGIEWTKDQIVLANIPSAKAGGCIVRTAGLLGSIRGANHQRQDGVSVRPSFIVIDDPQTDASAKSPSQVRDRLAVITGAILGLAGPGKSISAVMPCTVIREGDVSDQVLDRAKHPEWNGERTKMVYSFPTDTKLWDEYAVIRGDDMRNGGTGAAATEFYAAWREAMDAGAVVAWPARHNPDELSALQHAMNLKLRDERAFFAEYQNDPMPEIETGEDMLTAEEIAAKRGGPKRGIVPTWANHLTAFIDVQKNILWWMVCAWSDDFTGSIIDYGAYPDQRRAYFTKLDARRTMLIAHPGHGLEGWVYKSLEATVSMLADREWKREGGVIMHLDRLLIDAQWGDVTDVVYEFCRRDKHAGILLPSHGRGVGASGVPFADYQRKPGDRIGNHWRMPDPRARGGTRYIQTDVNFWKSFVHSRLRVDKGDRGCLSIFEPVEKEDHSMLADHLVAETGHLTKARGREVVEWKPQPNRDNDLLDCAVGCAAAASERGCVLAGTGSKKKPKVVIDLAAVAKQRAEEKAGKEKAWRRT